METKVSVAYALLITARAISSSVFNVPAST